MNAPLKSAPRHFLDISDHDSATLRAIILDARRRKQARQGLSKGVADSDRPLDGKVLAMIFDKQSTRTRISFDMAARQLGGSALRRGLGAAQQVQGLLVGCALIQRLHLVDAATPLQDLGPVIGPFHHGGDKYQFGQAEILHRPGRGPDICAHLGMGKYDGGWGHLAL